MNEKERLSLAEWVMEHSLKSGASEIAVQLGSERRIQVEFRDGNLDTLTEAQQNGLNLEVYVDKRYSVHSTNDLRKDELAKFIEGAVASTRYLAQDEYRGLPDPSLYPDETGGDLKIFDPDYEGIETTERVRIAREIDDAARAASDKIISSTGSYSDSRVEIVRVHSNGFMGGARGTRFNAEADVTVMDESGARPDGWSSANTRFLKDLLSPTYLAEEAAERALRNLGQQKIASGQYDCIIENRAGRRLFWMLQQPLTGRALQQKMSFLDGMMHKKVGSDKLTITDDPTLEKGLASRLFDGDGLAAKQLPLFEEGNLRNFYVDVYYGRKLGMTPTTGGSSNIVFAQGTRPLEAILKDVKKGILVENFIGGNSNPTTGDFSTGVAGFLIENGKRTTPIHEMNIAGNARDLLSRLAEVGSDPYRHSSVRTPTLLFEGVHFSGL
jgi:PmbA protein